MSGDLFVYGLIAMNLCAAIYYAYDGLWIKAFYWLCVIGLNASLLKMK